MEKSIFKVLVKNTVRILKKSKLFIVQLGILTMIGMTLLLTAFTSTTLLKDSKQEIIQNSNLADFTIQLSIEKVRESIQNDVQNSYINETFWQITNYKELKTQFNLAKKDIAKLLDKTCLEISKTNLTKIQNKSEKEVYELLRQYVIKLENIQSLRNCLEENNKDKVNNWSMIVDPTSSSSNLQIKFISTYIQSKPITAKQYEYEFNLDFEKCDCENCTSY